MSNVTKLFIGLKESIFNLSLSGLNVGVVLVQIESYNTLLTVDHNSFMTNGIVYYFFYLFQKWKGRSVYQLMQSPQDLH